METKKDFKRVEDYNRIKLEEMLRFNCINNSAQLLAGSFATGNVKLVTAQAIFNFAEALFDEAIKRDYLNYKKIQDNRTIDRATGKVVENANSQVGGLPVTLTEKEGREMDIDYPKNPDEVVI